jgi:cation:H+ antiporter
MFSAIFFLIVGLVFLIFGAEVLVRGSASLARRWGISSLVVGLTVVAFGTSAPELIVNLISAFKGATDLAIGNIIGSNISNIFLILGVTAIIYPLRVHHNTVWKEIPFALLGVVLLILMANDTLFDGSLTNIVGRTDGFALIAIFIIFMYYVFAISKSDTTKPEPVKQYKLGVSLLLALLGLVGLFLGGKWLVDGAVILARLAGLSESLIGLTIVAIGTSLPELATSIIAAYHKHVDMAVGNIVGSNIFNIFWVVGLTSTIRPLPFNLAANLDVLVAIVATALLFIFMFLGKRHHLSRQQGVLFTCIYITYLVYLIFRG